MALDDILGHTLAFGILAAFLFAVGCGIYMMVINVYRFLKFHGRPRIIDKPVESQRNLRAAFYFFVFMGVMTTIMGICGCVSQPKESLEAFGVILSGLYFLGLAYSSYKNYKKQQKH